MGYKIVGGGREGVDRMRKQERNAILASSYQNHKCM